MCKSLKSAQSTGGCDGAQNAAERSYPTSEVRGRSGRTPCRKGGGQEELPHIRGQGQRPRVPGCDSAGTAKRSYPASGVRGGDKRSYPASEVRAAAGRSYPTSKEWWLCRRRRA